MNRHVRVFAALVVGFVLGLLVGGDDAAGLETPRTLASTSSDTLPRDFADFVVGLHERPAITTPVTAPYEPVEPRKQARTATVPSEPATSLTGAVPDLIRAGFARFGSAVAEEAVAVAWCESRFNPSATNGVHAGLFQLSGRYHQQRAARLGYSWAQMWEAEPNIAVAADLYSEQGWRPWQCRS